MTYRVPKYPWQWNPWPFTRLAVVLTLIVLQAHICGWNVPWENIVALPGRILDSTVGIFLISGGWAFVYLFLWTLPLILALIVTDWLYAFSQGFLIGVCKMRSTWRLAALALIGEIVQVEAALLWALHRWS